MASVDVVWNFKFPKSADEMTEPAAHGAPPRYFVRQLRQFDADGASNDLSTLMRMF